MIHRAYNYSLPAELVDLVDFVSAVTRFPPVRPPRVLSFGSAPATVTPKTINTAYGIASNVVTNAGATQSLYESLGQYFSNLDLQQFFKTFQIPTQGIAKIIGPNDQVC